VNDEAETLEMQNPTPPVVVPKTGLTHADCVEMAASYLSKRCPVVLPEFFTFNSELPDVLGFERNCTWVIECKISRSDFKKDSLKSFRLNAANGMGDVRYFCCPKGLISKEELPEGWGLLYVYPSGRVMEVKNSRVFEKNIEAEYHALFYYARRAYYAGVHNAVLAYRGYDR
jgi:hypothetical protein